MLHAPPISFYLIWSPEKYWVKCTDHAAPHYAVFFQSTVNSSFLGPNILLSTLFSNTVSLCSPLNMRDQVSHPYKTAGNTIVLYFIPQVFWIANWKTKYSGLNSNRHSLCSIFSWFLHECNVGLQGFFFTTLSKNLSPVPMLWFCPAFSSPDMNKHLAFSAFTSTNLLQVPYKASVFFFIACMLSLSKLPSTV